MAKRVCITIADANLVCWSPPNPVLSLGGVPNLAGPASIASTMPGHYTAPAWTSLFERGDKRGTDGSRRARTGHRRAVHAVRSLTVTSGRHSSMCNWHRRICLARENAES